MIKPIKLRVKYLFFHRMIKMMNYLNHTIQLSLSLVIREEWFDAYQLSQTSIWMHLTDWKTMEIENSWFKMQTVCRSTWPKPTLKLKIFNSLLVQVNKGKCLMQTKTTTRPPKETFSCNSRKSYPCLQKPAASPLNNYTNKNLWSKAQLIKM